MTRIYEKADPDVMSVLDSVMRQYHEELDKAGVRVGVVMVTAPKGEVAIACHGHGAAAKIKRVGHAERVHAQIDALLQIDGYVWEELGDGPRRALLDHELTHLIVATKGEAVVVHADGRPKLVMRPDDWLLTGFADVVRRHKSNSLEARALRVLHDVHGQQLFEFLRPTEMKMKQTPKSQNAKKSKSDQAGPALAIAEGA